MITQPSTQPTGMIAVQAASAEVVGKVLSGKNLDRVLEADLAKLSRSIKLSPNERAAIHSISFDTLRHYGLLAAQLAHRASEAFA